jgi:hypothetical protein
MPNDYGWRNSQQGANRNYGNQKPFEAVGTISPDQLAKTNQQLDNRTATPVRLPPHLFIPEGAESLDIRRAADIAAGTAAPFKLMEFECPQGATCHFISYAIFSDGGLALNQEFIPRVDDRRVFPFQGDPQNNFKINLGLAPDLSNNSLIQCQLTINPGEKLQWYVLNTNAVDIAMGIRMVGYIDRSMTRVQGRTGG